MSFFVICFGDGILRVLRTHASRFEFPKTTAWGLAAKVVVLKSRFCVIA
jgi:hypothetical protein